MKRTASRWHRLLQLVGLVLIAVLSAEAGRAHAQEDEEDDPACTEFDGCRICHEDGDPCMTWFCEIGDPRGIGISCEGDGDDDETG